MATKSSKVIYPHLDLVKLAMALLVVEIHTRPFMDVPTAGFIVESIDVFAVPFFFIASGFLCFRGLTAEDFASEEARGAIRVRSTLVNQLRLYLTWTLLYLPVTIFGYTLQKKAFVAALVSFIRGTVFIGENFCSWQLWYLHASVIAFAVIYLLLCCGMSPKQLLVVATGFLLAGFFLLPQIKQYSNAPVVGGLIKTYFSLAAGSRNGLFEGFFYVAVGALAGMNYEKLGKLPVLGLAALLAFGVLGSMFIASDAHLPFCASASISIFLLSVRRSGTDLAPHENARQMSTVIYLVHMFFVVIFVYGICSAVNPNPTSAPLNRPLLYLFAVGGSVVVALAVQAIAKRAPGIKKIFGI